MQPNIVSNLFLENLIAVSKGRLSNIKYGLTVINCIMEQRRRDTQVKGDANCSHTELIYNFGNAPSSTSSSLQSDTRTIIAHTHDRTTTTPLNSPTETHLWFCTCVEKNSSRLFSCVRMQKAPFEIYCQICARFGVCVKERIRSKGSRARNAWMVMEEFRDVDKSHWAFVKH